MINSLLTFGAKSVKPEILEQTLTIRKETVDEIEKNCIIKTGNFSTWQSLIIAARGSGKTHLIKVLYHRLKKNKKISGKSVIAYMSEDEVGIANFTDLIVSILRAFVRYSEPGSETLESQISEASLIKDTNKREIFVKDILLKFADKRIIILLIENFDKILKSLGSQGQGSLRDFIHQYNNLSIIATSQNLIANLQDSKNPFYNFFNISQLRKLNFEETVSFLEAIAKTEGNKELAKEIKKPVLEGKLKAIYELTEGNHRLLVTFYSFLKADFKSELSAIFIKVMNDLKPYYEQFVNALPAQQQKIVKYLSLNRGAISGKEIAIACFIEPNVFSKQISLLYERGMIDKNKSGKNVFYELKEPLMRICLEISENPNGISNLFVNFLSTYYDRKIIKEQYKKYRYGARFQNKEIKNKYKKAIEAYKKSIALNPDNDSAYNSLGLIYLDTDNVDNAFEAFHKSLKINPDNMYTNLSLLGAYVRVNDQNKSKELIISLIKKVDNDLLTISLTEDIFYNLFRFGSDAFIKSYFSFLLKLMLNEKKDKQLWKSMPESLFNILLNIEDYEKERLNNIEKVLTELLTEYQESIIPLKMFSVGVAYLKNKEKNAIFKLSKEERKLFKEAVLDKRESLSRDK